MKLNVLLCTDISENLLVLTVGRSTVKRACRRNNIRRWPNRKQHKKNPPLFAEGSVADSEQEILPSTFIH